MATDILIENLGLSDKEAAVYVALLELGASSIKPIAARAGLRRTTLYYFIDHLVELGLVEKARVGGRNRYVARPPEEMLSLQERRLEALKDALPQFSSLYNTSTQKPRISYYEGVEQMKTVLWEETKCQNNIWAIWSGQEVADLFGQELLSDVDEARRQKGIQVQVVRIPDKDESFAPFREQPGANRELRYAPEGTIFPLAFTLYDTGKVGIMSSKKEGFGILIESAELFAAMKTLFDAFWNLSQPADKKEAPSQP